MDKIYSDEDILKLKKIAYIIVNRRRNHKKLNRYEYYMLGGVPFKNGENVLHKLYREKKLTIAETTILCNYIAAETVFGASRNKEFILKTYYQFGNRVITDEEKQSIWLSLNQLGLTDNDIDDLVFAGAIREYAKANGLLNNKTLVRKK